MITRYLTLYIMTILITLLSPVQPTKAAQTLASSPMIWPQTQVFVQSMFPLSRKVTFNGKDPSLTVDYKRLDTNYTVGFDIETMYNTTLNIGTAFMFHLDNTKKIQRILDIPDIPTLPTLTGNRIVTRNIATDLGLFIKPYLSVPIGSMWIFPFLRSDLSTGFHFFDSRELETYFTGLSFRVRGSAGIDCFINEWLGFSIMIAYDYLTGIKVGSFIPEEAEDEAARFGLSTAKSITSTGTSFLIGLKTTYF